MQQTADAAEQARGEAELSLQRQQEAREKIIKPLTDLGKRNQFASLIRASLLEGKSRQ